MTSYKKDVQPPIFLVCVKMIEKIFKIGWLSNLKNCVNSNYKALQKNQNISVGACVGRIELLFTYGCVIQGQTMRCCNLRDWRLNTSSFSFISCSKYIFMYSID